MKSALMAVALSAVLAPGDPNGLTKQTPTIAQYLKQANYTTVHLGKWHVGDKLENFPTSNGFDEMYDMLPYYAGVYAYADKEVTNYSKSRRGRAESLQQGPTRRYNRKLPDCYRS